MGKRDIVKVPRRQKATVHYLRPLLEVGWQSSLYRAIELP